MLIQSISSIIVNCHYPEVAFNANAHELLLVPRRSQIPIHDHLKGSSNQIIEHSSADSFKRE